MTMRRRLPETPSPSAETMCGYTIRIRDTTVAPIIPDRVLERQKCSDEHSRVPGSNAIKTYGKAHGQGKTFPTKGLFGKDADAALPRIRVVTSCHGGAT